MALGGKYQLRSTVTRMGDPAPLGVAGRILCLHLRVNRTGLDNQGIGRLRPVGVRLKREQQGREDGSLGHLFC